jgi:cytoskeleton protein RodZ
VPKNVSRKNRIPLRRNDPEGRNEAETATEPGSPGNPAGKRPGRLPPWDKGGEPEAGSFGTWLRRQRELREITLRDVADRTKISLRYLEAMEEDRFDLLPAPVFAKGFLREYARYVGLSPDEVVNHWLAVQQSGERPEGEEEEESAASSRRRLSRVLVLLALLVLAAVGGFAYYWQHHKQSDTQNDGKAHSAPGAPRSAPDGSASTDPDDSASTSQVPSPARSGAPGAPPSAAGRPVSVPPPTQPSQIAENPGDAPLAPLEVTIDFSRECWVDALIDGKKRIAEQRVAGEALRLPAQHQVQLTLGDAGAAEVQVNGAILPLPVVGKGQVLHNFNIDLDTVKSLKAKKETR